MRLFGHASDTTEAFIEQIRFLQKRVENLEKERDYWMHSCIGSITPSPVVPFTGSAQKAVDDGPQVDEGRPTIMGLRARAEFGSLMMARENVKEKVKK